MRLTKPITFAIWMLEYLPSGSRNESLAGDLLEEFQSGRSAAWFWRQALFAIAHAVRTRARPFAGPLAFSAGWSLLYPTFLPPLLRNPTVETVMERLSAHDWPYSTALHSVTVLIPALLFLWTGLFVYLASRRRPAIGPAPLRLLASLSVSLNVLLVATIVQHLIHTNPASSRLSQTISDGTTHTFCVPLVLSLFSALVCVVPAPRSRHHSPGSLAA